MTHGTKPWSNLDGESKESKDGGSVHRWHPGMALVLLLLLLAASEHTLRSFSPLAVETSVCWMPTCTWCGNELARRQLERHEDQAAQQSTEGPCSYWRKRAGVLELDDDDAMDIDGKQLREEGEDGCREDDSAPGVEHITKGPDSRPT